MAFLSASASKFVADMSMESDYTQQQSLGGLARAEQMSLRTQMPPADVAGYEMDKLLGQGAFGQVWLARDENTGRQVAIKFYAHHRGLNWDLLDREVKHLVSMSTGRHIVQVLAVGWDADPPYYVMEYLENGSLEDLIRAQGALTIPETVAKLREIAAGLTFAHRRGVLHCDLKPANVLLDHDWRPRLADFGQGRMTDEQTPSLGTLFFMAPEQADLTAVPNPGWDVYALGAIAYCMLVGSPPYRTPEIIETLDTAESLPERLTHYRATIRSAPKPKLHYRRRNIDKPLCQIIDRCLTVDAGQRFQTVEQVLAALDERHGARIRRPLYLLGIVGPLVLLGLMLFFNARSINVAKQQSLERIEQGALESNLFASRLAAQTLQSEIQTLYQIVESEAQKPELRRALQRLMENAKDDLRSIALGDGSSSFAERLRARPQTVALAEYLEERLQDIIAREDGQAGAAIFNSLFVNDSAGTNVAIQFASPEEQSSSPVGRNFAYRSYFHGGREDGDASKPAGTFAPTKLTHLSAPFRSTSTGKWKVGISTPIYASDTEAGNLGQDRPIGVIVLTINLGQFKLLTGNKQEKEHDRFAVLLDGRSGNGQGILLQHPYLSDTLRGQVSAELPVVPQINPGLLSRLQAEEGIVDYRDPAAEFTKGDEYEGQWIAAIQQVALPRGRPGGGRGKSDLWVLVQERHDNVIQPVFQLGVQLQREGYIALAAVLGVVATLWFFVFRQRRATLAKGADIGFSLSMSEADSNARSQNSDP